MRPALLRVAATSLPQYERRRSEQTTLYWLAALVPKPRLRLICFHGVLAPNAKLRNSDGAWDGFAEKRRRWPELLRG